MRAAGRAGYLRATGCVPEQLSYHWRDLLRSAGRERKGTVKTRDFRAVPLEPPHRARIPFKLERGFLLRAKFIFQRRGALCGLVDYDPPPCLPAWFLVVRDLSTGKAWINAAYWYLLFSLGY